MLADKKKAPKKSEKQIQEDRDRALDKKFPQRPGFRWFRDQVRSERAIARIEKKEAYDAAVYRKRAAGLAR